MAEQLLTCGSTGQSGKMINTRSDFYLMLKKHGYGAIPHSTANE